MELMKSLKMEVWKIRLKSNIGSQIMEIQIIRHLHSHLKVILLMRYSRAKNQLCEGSVCVDDYCGLVAHGEIIIRQ